MSAYFKHDTVCVDEGCTIGEGTKIWHFSHIMSGCVIGSGCNLGQNVMVASGGIIGNNVKIQNNVSIYSGVVCEDYVFLGPSVTFTNVINPRSHVDRKNEFRRTTVRRGATIGANSTIVCGNEIGEYAMVGAGSVVTHNVKPYALVAGNPARQIGWVSENGCRLNFDGEGIAVCPETGQEYRMDKDNVVRIK